jgi:hypothetical protein
LSFFIRHYKTAHLTHNRKECDNLLDCVFTTHINRGYIDYESMNTEIAAFEENGVVVGVDSGYAERNNLLPYEMFVVREGHERVLYERGVYGAHGLGITH